MKNFNQIKLLYERLFLCYLSRIIKFMNFLRNDLMNWPELKQILSSKFNLKHFVIISLALITTTYMFYLLALLIFLMLLDYRIFNFAYLFFLIPALVLFAILFLSYTKENGISQNVKFHKVVDAS